MDCFIRLWTVTVLAVIVYTDNCKGCACKGRTQSGNDVSYYSRDTKLFGSTITVSGASHWTWGWWIPFCTVEEIGWGLRVVQQCNSFFFPSIALWNMHQLSITCLMWNYESYNWVESHQCVLPQHGNISDILNTRFWARSNLTLMIEYAEIGISGRLMYGRLGE